MTSEQAYQEAERMYKASCYHLDHKSKKSQVKVDKFYQAYLFLLKLGDKLKDQAQQ
jgi:hypothetical protein